MLDLLLIAIGAYVIFSKISRKPQNKQKQSKKSKFFEFRERDLKKYFTDLDEETKKPAEQKGKEIIKKQFPAAKEISWDIVEKKDKPSADRKLQGNKDSIMVEKKDGKKDKPSPKEMFLYYELLSKPKSLRK